MSLPSWKSKVSKLLHATFILLTKIFIEKSDCFNFFNFLICYEVKTYTGNTLGKRIWLVTSSVWSRDFLWKWFLICKVHRSHVAKVTMSSIISFCLESYDWSKFKSYMIYRSQNSKGVYIPPPSTNYVYNQSSMHEGLIITYIWINIYIYIYIYIYIWIIWKMKKIHYPYLWRHKFKQSFSSINANANLTTFRLSFIVNKGKGKFDNLRESNFKTLKNVLFLNLKFHIS